MGDILGDFFGNYAGGGHGNQPPSPSSTPGPTQEEVYTPPDLRKLFKAFQETGTVPYSYYGVSAPTREGELDLVRASYPGAFSMVDTPQAEMPPAEVQNPKRKDPFENLFGQLFSIPFGIFGSENGLSGLFKDYK
jgi:hypothetical protein